MVRLFYPYPVRKFILRRLFLITFTIGTLFFLIPDTVMAQAGHTPLMNDDKVYSSREVISKLNAFFVQYKKTELALQEMQENQSSAFRVYKAPNFTLSLNTQTIEGEEQIYSIMLNGFPGTNEKLNDFIACSMGLMGIFTPEMNEKVRGEVLSRMMGLKRDDKGQVHYAPKNTYIIVNTKYNFVYSTKTGLELTITQMPPLEPYEGVPKGL